MSRLYSSFFEDQSIMIILINNQSLLPTAYLIFSQYLFEDFDGLFGTIAMIFQANSLVIYIFSKMYKWFLLKIRLYIILLDNFPMSKLIQRYKFLFIIIKESLISTDSFLFGKILQL